MANFSIDQIGFSFANVDSAQQFPLNSIQRDQNGNEYIYLKGVASTVVGAVVTYDEVGVTALLVADATGPCAIAQALTVASTFGWYLIAGSCQVITAGDVADNGNMYSTATAGAVDDAVVAGDRIKGGANFRGARTGAGLVLCQFNRPFVDNAADGAIA
jgi:hypothetical protein